MKSETIFRYTNECRGRYDNLYGTIVTITADFSNPTVWPYQVICRNWWSEIGSDTREEETDVHRISKAVFEEIKKTIQNHSKLATCREIIDNEVMDSNTETFYFHCDTFTRSMSGLSILGSAVDDLDKPFYQRSDNYTIYAAHQDIKAILEANNIDVL